MAQDLLSSLAIEIIAETILNKTKGRLLKAAASPNRRMSICNKVAYDAFTHNLDLR